MWSSASCKGVGPAVGSPVHPSGFNAPTTTGRRIFWPQIRRQLCGKMMFSVINQGYQKK